MEPLIKWIFSSGQGREDWRKVVNMLYINNFLEFRPDADLAEIDFNQRFPSIMASSPL